MPLTRVLLLPVLASMLALVCCASGHAPGRTPGPEPSQRYSGLAGLLPAPASIPAAPAGRVISSLYPAITQDAADYRSDLPHSRALLDGDALVLSSGYLPGGPLAGMAFAIFSFDAPAPERAAELRVIWDTAPLNDSSVWLAAANQQSGRWDIYPGIAEESGGIARHRASLPAWTPYTAGPGGKLHMAVLVAGSESCRLRRLRAGDPFVTGGFVIPASGVVPLQVSGNFSSSIIPGSERSSLAIYYKPGSEPDALSPLSEYTYNIPGVHQVRAVVTNDEGLSAESSIGIYAAAKTWVTSQLAEPDSALSSKFWPSSAVVGGRPAVAYVHHDSGASDGDPEEYSIEYLIAADWPGSEWQGPFTAYSTAAADKPVAIGGLLDCNGKPGIFYRTEEGSLFFLRGDAAEPAAWTAPVFLDHGLDADSGIGVGLADLRPCVAYCYNTPLVGWSVWFQRNDSFDADGIWSQSLVGAGKGDLSLRTDGLSNPVLAVHLPLATPGHVDGGMAFYRAPNVLGISEQPWQLLNVFGSGEGYQGSGPAAAFTNFGSVYMCFRAQSGGTGLGERSLVNIDSGDQSLPNFVADESFFDAVERPLGVDVGFSLYDASLGRLQFVGMETDDLNLSGNSGADPLVDDEGDVGRHSTLVAPLGLPAIFYEDSAARSVKFAQLVLPLD
ncbi:hypothetical protein IT575_01530 [bacterium]|nr:hypothetical protein [bacterium]